MALARTITNLEGSTTRAAARRVKRLEARGIRKDDDIVLSAWRHAAAY